VLCIASVSYANNNDKNSKLTIGAPDEAAEFAIGTCLGTLDNLDRIRLIAKTMDWKPLTKEQLLMLGTNEDLNAEGWLAIVDNHPYMLAINQGKGAWRNNKFNDGLKSNVCTVMDLYSARLEIITSFKKQLDLKQVYNDPGKTIPLGRMDAFKINNSLNRSEDTYMFVISHKDFQPPIIISFMAEYIEK
jgi:hypothetical protein